MEVQINVTGNPDTMTQANSQRIKRAGNMLREAGFIVNINWNADVKVDALQSTTPLRQTIPSYR